MRENLVRAGLLLLVLGVIATLMVLDRTRGDDRPGQATERITGRITGRVTEPSQEPARTPNEGASRSPTETTTGTVVPLPTKKNERGKGRADVIPTPPPGIEAIACRKLQESVQVRVLDFNTHRSYAGIAAVAAQIEALEPDIVLLQEVDRFHARTGGIDQAAYLAEALGMNHAFGANVRSAGAGEYGVAILSRFEILSTRNYLLPSAPGAEQRGLLGVGLDIGGQEVRVYTTHLQNKMVGLREAQARHIAGIIASEQNPVILGGDMNAGANTATLAPLTRLLVDAWTTGFGPAGTGPNGSRIDFLLASPTITPQRAQALRSPVSDHARLYADFVVPASTDCPTAPRTSNR